MAMTAIGKFNKDEMLSSPYTSRISTNMTQYDDKSLRTTSNGASGASSALTTRRQTVGTVGPIMVPADLTPKLMAKGKNESMFTTALLSGSASGYAHLAGGSHKKF